VQDLLLSLVEKAPLVVGLAVCFYASLLAALHSVDEDNIGTSSSPSWGDTILALDGLRGIAILMVVSFHVFQWFNPAFGMLGRSDLVRNGWSGVGYVLVNKCGE
jgi:hypothetical protein